MASKHVRFLLTSICILATQTTKGAFGLINSHPLNSVVYEGSTNTTFTCVFNNGANQGWTLVPFSFTGNSDEVFLATGEALNPSFNESFAFNRLSVPGKYNSTLIVLNATISSSATVSLSTAGAYWCKDADMRFIFQLVVIRSDPICSSNVTQSTAMLQSGDIVQLSCTIVYGSTRDPVFKYEYGGEDYNFDYGTIDAVLTWTVDGEPADNANVSIVNSPTEVTATSTLLINDNFDATYVCGTTFSAPSGSIPSAYYTYTDPNAPDYFNTCTISLSGTPTISSPTATATPPTSTTTTKTSSAPAPTTTTELPICSPNILELLLSLVLRASCYDDWICCSPVGIFLQTCPDHCKSLRFSGGTCKPSTSVGCPCIPPGNKKCHCF